MKVCLGALLVAMSLSCTQAQDDASSAGAAALAGERIALSDSFRAYDLEGVPVVGDMRYAVDLTAPDGDLARASGTVTLRCGACTVGDGVARYKPRAGPFATHRFAAEGLAIPATRLGDIDGRIDFDDGKGTVTIAVNGAADLRANVTGTVALASALPESQVDLTAAIVLEDTLAPTLAAAASLLPGASQDDKIQLRLTGTLGQPRIRPTRAAPDQR